MRDLLESLGPGTVDPSRFGGKAAGLGRLLGFGHRVPAGLVVTVEAFEAAIRQLSLEDALNRLETSLRHGTPDLSVADEIRHAIRYGGLPDGLGTGVKAAATELWHQAGLIVRSSATVEDSARHSFAGIFESEPVTQLEDLESSIQSVWASVFTPRAMSYAAMCGLTEIPKMALVVQELVPAERSGVMFTTFRSPDGANRVLIEHVEGTAEKLVRGEVMPERVWLGHDLDTSGSLPPEIANELHQLASTLEAQFDGPQDVEWCVQGESVFVVQTRPITGGMGVVQPAAPDQRALLTGLGASPGVGSGAVHLVFNIDHALATQPGEVLVTPMTNPDMVVAMRRSSAIVTDVGGMICHAAIVSRELGLPCVVGTSTASSTLVEGQMVTVDGSSGEVLEGEVRVERTELPQGQPSDVWAIWMASPLSASTVPLVSTIEFLNGAPQEVSELVLAVDYDLRCDSHGLWRDLEREEHEVKGVLDGYLAEVEEQRGDRRIRLAALGAVSDHQLAEAVERLGSAGIGVLDDQVGPVLSIVRALTSETSSRRRLPGVEQATERMNDPTKVFGHRPSVQRGPMPDATQRATWHSVLPEYGRFHREHFVTEGEQDWVNVRPEIVISPLLKSLVQPGFEMVPRILGFSEVPPMYTKWIRGRFHFRGDTFARTWRHIVGATWDSVLLARLMTDVRQSYDNLAEVLELFPDSEEELRELSPGKIVALITSWWPRWVEFFALSQFVQAQGDDLLYPFIEETVAAHDRDLRAVGHEIGWPSARDLVAPTTPVLSAGFMESIGRVRSLLAELGYESSEPAVAALAAGRHPELEELIDLHLRDWHWMRDRDLLFEPWDTPEKVVETALQTESHTSGAYEENLRRNRFATAFHADLAEVSGRSSAFHHAARFLQDLNLERENHHVLWLKYSYPLRRLVVEVERRFVESGSLQHGEVFFMQAPELLSATLGLPEPLTPELLDVIRNRRRGYLLETKLADIDPSTVADEDDYF